MPTHYHKDTNTWTSDYQSPEAVADAFNRITSIRANFTQVRFTIDNEKWINALFRLMEVKRQIGELEALIKREANLVDEAAYLRLAQGKENVS